MAERVPSVGEVVGWIRLDDLSGQGDC